MDEKRDWFNRQIGIFEKTANEMPIWMRPKNDQRMNSSSSESQKATSKEKKVKITSENSKD